MKDLIKIIKAMTCPAEIYKCWRGGRITDRATVRLRTGVLFTITAAQANQLRICMEQRLEELAT